ncbi:putative E3 ubiquitin-protein ligase HECTD1 [Paratrimastix pyriformis]|uniref:E3 ubiquitin-protein ligase HECTD1 n=1 Tax=Paratrimastix pyriformis TaxID=342808 RepID=A0ABQ8U7S6_9EUKA|nr:putative E3 ubiquitin-protein ligase HECTD1 [Paratrimastix pyriformis]
MEVECTGNSNDAQWCTKKRTPCRPRKQLEYILIEKGDDENWRCPACLAHYEDPVCLSCGDTICRACVACVGIVCPTCCEKFIAEEWRPSRMAQRQVRQIQCHCPNSGLGCAAIIGVLDVEHHLGAECEWREEECDQCHQQVRRAEMAHHKDTICTAKPMACGYADVGCETRCTPGSLAAHERDGVVAHVGFLRQRLADTSADLAHCKADLAQCKTELGGQLAATSADLAQARAQLVESRAEVTQCQAALNQTQHDLAQTRADLVQARAELGGQLTATQADLAQTRADLSKTQQELAAVRARIDQVRSPAEDGVGGPDHGREWKRRGSEGISCPVAHPPPTPPDRDLILSCGVFPTHQLVVRPAAPVVEVLFLYNHNMDEQGLFYYIGTQGHTQPFRNPAKAGLITVSRSTDYYDDNSKASDLTGRQPCASFTADQPNSWWKIDLGAERLFTPTRYTLRHSNLPAHVACRLQSWHLEGSVDGVRWRTLDEYANEPNAIPARPDAMATFAVAPERAFPARHFRVLMTGPSPSGYNYLMLSGLEMYGTLRQPAH